MENLHLIIRLCMEQNLASVSKEMKILYGKNYLPFTMPEAIKHIKELWLQK